MLDHPVLVKTAKVKAASAAVEQQPLFGLRTVRPAAIHSSNTTRELHKACTREMLPWLFAFDRIIYARYTSAYWCQMVNLPATHPGAHQALLAGEFGAQRSTKPFAQVAVDQTIKQSMNRHSKMRKGGTVWFSKHPSATQRWQFTAHMTVCR